MYEFNQSSTLEAFKPLEDPVIIAVFPIKLNNDIDFDAIFLRISRIDEKQNNLEYSTAFD